MRAGASYNHVAAQDCYDSHLKEKTRDGTVGLRRREWLFMIIAGIAAALGAFRWYSPLIRRTTLGQRGSSRALLALTPPAALGALLLVLCTWADPKYVVGHVDYIIMF